VAECVSPCAVIVRPATSWSAFHFLGYLGGREPNGNWPRSL